jgi:hypothetical protein
MPEMRAAFPDVEEYISGEIWTISRKRLDGKLGESPKWVKVWIHCAI